MILCRIVVYIRFVFTFDMPPYSHTVAYILYNRAEKNPHFRKEKTLLLFVIRDHVGATPLANLSNTLKADLEKIWQGLSKVSYACLLFVVHA